MIDIPQVIAIVKAGREGTVTLKRAVRRRIGAKNGRLFVKSGKEVLLTAKKLGAASPVQTRGNRVSFPQSVVAGLGLEKGCYVAFIERPDAAAVKRLRIEKRPGAAAQVVDYETPREVRRVAVTNPTPDEALGTLKRRCRSAKLKHDVRAFLRGRRSVEAWKARRLLGMARAGDEPLRADLVRERLAAQCRDGSWGGRTVPTARCLRELLDLGLGRRTKAVRAAAKWLLARAESPTNPGMFFLTDELVAKQAECRQKRRRFRDLRKPEIELAGSGDDLFGRACGPRIMWPNALVLEALLAAGCERHPRVREAIGSLVVGGWCECGYQMGHPIRHPRDVDERLAECRRAYHYGGVADVAMLAKMDASKTCGIRMPRVSHAKRNGRDVYALRMERDIPPCGLVTVRAIHRAKGAAARRRAEAELWQLASRQNGPQGRIGRAGNDRWFRSGQQPVVLQTFARYDLPVAKVGILRSVPWIANQQNADGSWGIDPGKDAATLAIVEALLAVRPFLPPGFLP